MVVGKLPNPSGHPVDFKTKFWYRISDKIWDRIMLIGCQPEWATSSFNSCRWGLILKGFGVELWAEWKHTSSVELNENPQAPPSRLCWGRKPFHGMWRVSWKRLIWADFGVRRFFGRGSGRMLIGSKREQQLLLKFIHRQKIYSPPKKIFTAKKLFTSSSLPTKCSGDFHLFWVWN